MQYSLLAGALSLALVAPVVLADATSTETSTYSTTSHAAPGEPAYSSSKIEQKVDAQGNVIKKTQNYNSTDPATGMSNSNSSTTVVSPDGSKSTVEHARSTDGTYGGTSVTEKRTTTVTSP